MNERLLQFQRSGGQRRIKRVKGDMFAALRHQGQAGKDHHHHQQLGEFQRTGNGLADHLAPDHVE